MTKDILKLKKKIIYQYDSFYKALCSEISPDRLWGPHEMPEIELASAECKTNTLSAIHYLSSLKKVEFLALN